MKDLLKKMTNVKVVSVTSEVITFDGNIKLYSSHEQDCCESHYLCMEHLTLNDFEGLLFDLSNDDFFKRVDGYGIRLKPKNDHEIPIPGYGYNNGYYSTELTLELRLGETYKTFDISECQDISS